MRPLLLLLLTSPIFAQTGVRYDNYNITSANNYPFGAQTPVFTMPNSTVTICSYPDDGGQPCGNVINVYSDPALTQVVQQPLVADTHGRFGFWLAPGTYTYSVVTAGGQFAGTYIFTLGGTGGGSGGCSSGGISTTNGIVTGDNTSTNCGYQNRTSDTVVPPGYVQTFGYQNGPTNGADHAVLIGNGNGASLQGTNVVGIGNANLTSNTGGGFQDTIVLGDLSLMNVTSGGSELFVAGSGAGNWLSGPGNLIAIGNGAASGQSGLLGQLDESIFFGDSAGGHASGTNIIGVGQGAGSQYLPGASDIVGVGNGAGSGYKDPGTFLPTCAPHDVVGVGNAAAYGNCGSDVIAIGDSALVRTGSGGNTGSSLTAIGTKALWHNTSGANNVAVGNSSGANFGFENHTGSQNTWVGDFAGPNTTTQLSNTIAIGYQAYNTASNQTVIGNSSTTEAHIYGTFFTPASSSAACSVPQTAYDANYAYFCVAPNTWKRVALTSF